MNEAIFYSAIAFTSIYSRINLIFMRSGMSNALSRTGIEVFIELFASFSSVAILVWGIININWWLPIVSLIVLSLIAGSIVTSRTLGLFAALYSSISLIIIGLNLFLWLSE